MTPETASRVGRFALVVGEPIDQIDPLPFAWSEWDDVLDGFETSFYRGITRGVVAERRYPSRLGSVINGEHLLATLKRVSRELPSEHMFDLAAEAKVLIVEASRPQREGATCFWPCAQFIQEKRIVFDWLDVLLAVHNKEGQPRREHSIPEPAPSVEPLVWAGTISQLAYLLFMLRKLGFIKTQTAWKQAAALFVREDGSAFNPQALSHEASTQNFKRGGASDTMGIEIAELLDWISALEHGRSESMS